MRQITDTQRQRKAAHQHEQMVKAHEASEREKWANHRADTLGPEPDFPGDFR